MPGTYFGPFNEQYSDYAEPAGGNCGRYPLGHTLILPDGREYRFDLNGAVACVAGNLYQSIAPVAHHTNVVCSTAPTIGDTTIAATLGATAAAIDIYSEGIVHTNDETGEGYAYRIERARANGQAHAAVDASGIITVKLEAGEKIQVTGVVSTADVTFTRNRYHSTIIHLSPPTATLSGVSPGVAAASRYYWSQVKGPAPCFASGTLLVGLPVMAGITVNGTVESTKRRLGTGGATALMTTTAHAVLYLLDSAGTTTGYGVVTTTALTTAALDVTGGIGLNAPTVGICTKVNADTEYALVDLNIN